MKTINDHWTDFRNKAYPPAIPASQEREMRVCFMAGAAMMFESVTAIATGQGEDAAVAELERQVRQLQFERLTSGRELAQIGDAC